MHVNFLHPFFEPRVDCDVVTSDGYPATNLISTDFRERSRGFLAAHFIKPPAILLFQLPFPVHVESIVVKPKVGSQISSGIAILVAEVTAKPCLRGKREISVKRKPRIRSKRRTSESLLGSSANKRTASGEDAASSSHEHSTEEKSLITHKYIADVTPSSVRDEHLQYFTQVAWLNNQEGHTTHFQNRQFKERSPVQGIPFTERSDIQQGEFQRLHCLQKVTHVALRVVRLNGSCVPAIGKVEIWGQPATSCIPEVVKYAINIQVKIIQTHQPAVVVKSASNGAEIDGAANNEKFSTLGHGNSSIPEDFVDPITCDVMTIPLLLPSGHNIDTSTLEKHINAERLWGRLPSDPFTGKVFSTTCKAIPNGALKVRIDKFLLTSGVNMAAFGRTVGRLNHSGEAVDPKKVLPSKTGGVTSLGKVLHVIDERKEPQATGTNGSYHQKYPQRTSGSNMSEDKETELGHEEAVSKSLDSALHQTLQGLQMFTRTRTSHQNDAVITQSSIIPASTGSERRKRHAPSETLKNSIKKRSSVLCMSCQRDLSTECIFHLPCQHVICRQCLTAVMQPMEHNVCKQCGANFRQMDAVRVHNS